MEDLRTDRMDSQRIAPAKWWWRPSWLGVGVGCWLAIMAIKDAREFHAPGLFIAAFLIGVFTLSIAWYLLRVRTRNRETRN
jgi:hypothetical protein